MNIEGIINGNHGIEGVRWALEGRQARRNLRITLEDALEGGQLGDCLLQRARFKPGRKLTAYYNVHLNDNHGGEGMERLIEVVWALPGSEENQDGQNGGSAGLDGSHMQAEAVGRGIAAPFGLLSIDKPAWLLRVRVSPYDPNFPQLVRLSDPGYIPGLVESAIRASCYSISLESAHSYRVKSIRYRPEQRHVLRYDPLPEAGKPASGGAIFAKLYNNPSKGMRSFRVAMGVSDWLTDHVAGMIGARPLAYLAEEGVILYPEIFGTQLAEMIPHGHPELLGYLQTAGQGIRSLHGAAESLGEGLKTVTFADDIKEVKRSSEHLQVLLPEVYAQILSLLDRLQDLYGRLPQESPTFTHSDYKADHLWMTRAGLALIDFDTCSLADPALDVGKFCADLRFWYTQYQREGLDQAQQAFLQGYAADPQSSPDPSGARLRRARLYESLILIKITLHRVRLFDPQWAERTQRLVQCAEEILPPGL